MQNEKETRKIYF